MISGYDFNSLVSYPCLIIEIMPDSKLVKLLAVYALFNVAIVLVSTFDIFYFKSNGFTEADLVGGWFFWAIAPLIVIFILNNRSVDSRLLMFLGIITRAISALSLALLEPSSLLFAFYLFTIGLGSFLFWVPFNVMYFSTSKGHEAKMGSIYFSMASAFGLIIPLLSGFIISDFGFKELFMIDSLLYMAMAFSLFIFEKSKHVHNLKDCLNELKGFKTLIFIEGIYGGGLTAILMVVPLLYFSKPVELAVFLSATTIFSIIASLVASHLSDKNRKRKKYVSSFGTGLAVATFLGTFASTASLWYLAVSARNFFATLFWPFTTTILVDNKRHMVKSMVGREWLLNVGRFLGLVIVFVCTLYANILLSMAFLGLVIALYPLIIELKKMHIKVE